MKVRKDGTAKLERGEVRIGNFFIKDEPMHVKVQDLNSVISLRIRHGLPVWLWLKNILGMGAKGEGTIKTWVAVLWSLLSVVPDDDFIAALMRETRECLGRHPEWYGGVKDATDADDEKAVEQVRAVSEFGAEAEKVAEDEG